MAMGTASPIGTGVYTWSLLLDPVLSEEEQLSLAERLRAEPGLGNFFGTAGGFYEELETGGLYCEVVGVVDEERESSILRGSPTAMLTGRSPWWTLTADFSTVGS